MFMSREPEGQVCIEPSTLGSEGPVEVGESGLFSYGEGRGDLGEFIRDVPN